MKFVFKILTLLIITFSINFSAIAKTNSEFQIVAKVNDEIITKHDLDYRYQVILLSLRGQGVKNRDFIYKQSLEQLIEDEVKRQDLINKNIKLEEGELNYYIHNIEKDKRLKRGGLKSYFASNNVSYDDYLQKVKNDILWNKLIKQNIEPNIAVFEYEIEEAVEYILKDSNRVRFNVSEIFIPVKNINKKNETKKSLEKLVKEIEISNNFEEVATKISRSSTSKNFGNIGWLDENDINEKIFNGIKNLEKGEISNPVFIGDNESGGFYIFKLNDKKIERVIKEEEMNRVKSIIYNQKLNVAIKKYLDNLKSNAFVEIYNIFN
jgi:peptidyl-prolyl cis-trans isomerase SurA